MDQVALDQLAARASTAGFESIPHYAVALEEIVESGEQVIRDYEAWLDKALAALGVDTVFEIPGVPS